MSIYATLWDLKFPADGSGYPGCDWVRVYAQGVPPHIGTPTPGQGYEAGDPYSDFLPPAIETDENGDAPFLRAVVIVRRGTRKGTERSGQEFPDPLLVLTGEEYAAMSMEEVYNRVCRILADQ